jgi:serine/threonine protein kinase
MSRQELVCLADHMSTQVYLDLVDNHYLQARKVISVSPDQRDIAIEHFHNREFSLQKRFLYPSIARVFDFEVNESRDSITITMDFIGGGTLGALTDQEYQDGEVPGFDFTQKLIMAFIMSKTVSFLHSQKIIYRDLKAGNWMIDENFLPVLIDFGFAKSVAEDNPLTYKTGTVCYNPPEIITKERLRRFNESERSEEKMYKVDVYTFGLTLYEMFTALQPFPNWKDADIAEQIIGGLHPSFDGVGLPVCAVQDICERCWSETADDRPTMEEVTEAIWEIVDDYGLEEFVDRDRFATIADEWDERVARAQREESNDEFIHGTLEKLEICAERGLGPAVEHLDLVIANLGA